MVWNLWIEIAYVAIPFIIFIVLTVVVGLMEESSGEKEKRGSIVQNVMASPEYRDAATRRRTSTSSIKVGGVPAHREMGSRPHVQGMKKDKIKEQPIAVDPKYLAVPQGVLAIHIKSAQMSQSAEYVPGKNLPSLIVALFEQQSVNLNQIKLFVRVRLGINERVTRQQNYPEAHEKVVFDEMKNLPATVYKKRSDGNNKIEIDLLGYDHRRKMKKTIGRGSIHLYDVIKNGALPAQTMDLTSTIGVVVANIETEICFCYGALGYGHSNQLENRQGQSSREAVKHSMFFRPEPEADRKLPHLDVEARLPVLHPVQVPFTTTCPNFSNISKRLETTDLSDLEYPTVDKPIMLMKRMTPRLQKMLDDYHKCETRRARMNYLQDRVGPHREEGADEVQIKEAERLYEVKKMMDKSGGMAAFAATMTGKFRDDVQSQNMSTREDEDDSVQNDHDHPLDPLQMEILGGASAIQMRNVRYSVKGDTFISDGQTPRGNGDDKEEEADGRNLDRTGRKIGIVHKQWVRFKSTLHSKGKWKKRQTSPGNDDDLGKDDSIKLDAEKSASREGELSGRSTIDSSFSISQL